jgi:hypothetical protein
MSDYICVLQCNECDHGLPCTFSMPLVIPLPDNLHDDYRCPTGCRGAKWRLVTNSEYNTEENTDENS